MQNVLFSIVVWGALLVPHAGLADSAGCDATTGITERRQASSYKVVATASAEAILEEPDSIRSAEDEAQLAARARLSNYLREQSIPYQNRGLRSRVICRDGLMVYARASYDPVNAESARDMQQQIEDSMKNNPTPKP